MLKRSVDTLKRLLFQGNRVYKDITENNPHERPYYKHEEKELKEQITMLEKVLLNYNYGFYNSLATKRQ